MQISRFHVLHILLFFCSQFTKFLICLPRLLLILVKSLRKTLPILRKIFAILLSYFGIQSPVVWNGWRKWGQISRICTFFFLIDHLNFLFKFFYFFDLLFILLANYFVGCLNSIFRLFTQLGLLLQQHSLVIEKESRVVIRDLLRIPICFKLRIRIRKTALFLEWMLRVLFVKAENDKFLTFASTLRWGCLLSGCDQSSRHYWSFSWLLLPVQIPVHLLGFKLVLHTWWLNHLLWCSFEKLLFYIFFLRNLANLEKSWLWSSHIWIDGRLWLIQIIVLVFFVFIGPFSL